MVYPRFLEKKKRDAAQSLWSHATDVFSKVFSQSSLRFAERSCPAAKIVSDRVSVLFTLNGLCKYICIYMCVCKTCYLEKMAGPFLLDFVAASTESTFPASEL